VTVNHPIPSPPLRKVATDMPEATGFRISPEIRDDRVYEPYALLAARFSLRQGIASPMLGSAMVNEVGTTT